MSAAATTDTLLKVRRQHTGLMICETGQQREAMVHVTGSRRIESFSGEPGANEQFEHHFCEPCASSNPLVNPALEYGLDARTEKLRVISTSAERTVLRLLRTETQPVAEEWSVLTSQLPPQYAVVGMEFEITSTPAELKRFQGTENN